MPRARKKIADAPPAGISEPPMLLPAPEEPPAEPEVIGRGPLTHLKSPRFLAGGVPLRLRITKEMRALVRDLAEWGIPQEMMVKHFVDPNSGIPITVNTLRHYFATELNEGMAEAHATLGRTAYRMAIGHGAEYDAAGNLIREEQKPDRKMLIFEMRVRMKYSDRLIIEHHQVETDDLSQHLQDLSPDELWQLRSLLSKPVRGIEDGTPPEGGASLGGEKP